VDISIHRHSLLEKTVIINDLNRLNQINSESISQRSNTQPSIAIFGVLEDVFVDHFQINVLICGKL